MKGVPIVDQHFQERRLRIAFHPLDERFEVTNTAIEKDPAWIADISVLWRADFQLLPFLMNYLSKPKERRPLRAEEEKQISEAVQRLVNLKGYTLSALEIAVQTTEEQVSDIFARINSQGCRLN